MSLSSPTPVLLGTAVLLVLLPPLSACEASSMTRINGSLRTLQEQLGTAIRVLKIDEDSHPAVVRSFGMAELPACVLVRQGVELWRQQGLPVEEGLVTTLLSKVCP